jgi:hypothetical protein
MSYKLLIGPSIVAYLSGAIPTLNISKPNDMSSSLFITKAKQKNVLADKIQ